MEKHSKNELETALAAIADMMARSKKAQVKFPAGTSQYTLAQNRIHALRVASALIERELWPGNGMVPFSREELERAAAPLASLKSKSEKARCRLTPGTWQHTMTERNLRALYIAIPLLEGALG